LTASVQTSNGVPVSVGQVIFCDANVAHCNPVMNLATAQLTSSGVAVVKLSAGTIGSHSYKAIFLGTTALTTSTSSTQAVTVTGTYPSFTMITSTGGVGAYDLTATVAGVGSGILSPTGTISFNDTSNSNTPLLGTATLGSATLSYSAVQPAGSPVSVGKSPYGAAAGDFNGDGFVDLVVENYNSNTVSVLLGNGDGTFQPQVTYAVGTLPERVLVADFNGDGILDLVVANTGSNNISILLGNGDGTFQPQVTYPVSSPVGLGVMDLNHDGIADIVASDYYSNTVSVLLGNGDGTFKAAVTYPTGNTPQTLAEGDFNGDGNVDLAVGNLNDNTVGIYLGNGDGTFKAAVTYSVGSQPQGVQVGDFNGDGFADLAVSNSGDGTVSVLLGKGDGTFQAQVPYAVGGSPVGLAIADFNGDGNQDISVDNAAQSSLSQSVLLGKGDGTFQTQLTFKTGNFPYGLAVGDFNGDGYPDMAISNDVDGTSTILLSQVTQTATATITGVALSGAVGTHNIDASYPGDTNFGMSVSATIPLTSGSAGAPTLASISPASGSVGSAAVTVTLTGTNFSVSDIVQLNGTAVVSAFINATTLTAVIPASFLATAGTGQIAVFDPVSGATTVALPFVVTATPQIVFSGPTTAAPDQQPALTLTLVNPYPVALAGTLTLTFAPSGAVPVDDPNVQFATGGRTLAFNIPALSTATPTVQLQTGTVAGTVTVTLVVTANGTNVTPTNAGPVVITIPVAVPAISAASLVKAGATLSVVVQGYSNTRELTTAIFHFVAADGSTVSTPDITAPVTTVFANWFTSAASDQYGSAFTYTQNFTLNNDASTIGSVTVTLVNSVGNSTQQTAQ
jgi:hypothetical protein